MGKLRKNNPGTETPAIPAPESNSLFSLWSDFDVALFKAGKHYRLYEKFGAREVMHNGTAGTYFSVWAPNAEWVSVIGSFNGWNRSAHPMHVRWDSSGIWELFIPGLKQGEHYKYFIRTAGGYSVEKSDPYAVHAETPPATASVVWSKQYDWSDQQWMQTRKETQSPGKPLSVYELHIGSWRRKEDNQFLSYRELAEQLPGYCQYMNYTHVELMPVMEHPFYGSWGYQVTGYFAPSSRYGTPPDFMHLVNALHKAGIGVILDWVPSHFPTDEHGPGFFDGTHLYEHADPRKGFHPDWKSFIFNYGRAEVRSFLISNALYWLDKYHIDGIRVDAVASMLYLDYSREQGEWIPNEYGGRENLEAAGFLKEFNQAVHAWYPEALTIAEESTAWPGVTQPVQNGGLGFDLKWMMGWMHDTLTYFKHDPVHRGYHQGLLIFSIYYTFSEKFMLPLSHDEVVHGKHSLIEKMPGDGWQKFANLRLLYGYMYGHPGAKLLFMGGEFAHTHEWQHDHSLDWHENNDPAHTGIQLLVKDLNMLYKTEKALYENNYSYNGFEWLDFNDAQNSVLCWVRKGKEEADTVLLLANYTPVPRHNYRIGVPARGFYTTLLNSDASKYGGSNCVETRQLETSPIAKHGRKHSLSLTLPPLGIIILKRSGDLC